ncbi:hypothetical protein DPEC_G00368260 [Dallia pectoralis]|nr:hypothetical protein DPEC_G00368260 [Dallia pectoralis]
MDPLHLSDQPRDPSATHRLPGHVSHLDSCAAMNYSPIRPLNLTRSKLAAPDLRRSCRNPPLYHAALPAATEAISNRVRRLPAPSPSIRVLIHGPYGSRGSYSREERAPCCWATQAWGSGLAPSGRPLTEEGGGLQPALRLMGPGRGCSPRLRHGAAQARCRLRAPRSQRQRVVPACSACPQAYSSA